MLKGLGAQKKKSNFFLEKYKFWPFLIIIVNIPVDIDFKRVIIDQ